MSKLDGMDKLVNRKKIRIILVQMKGLGLNLSLYNRFMNFYTIFPSY